MNVFEVEKIMYATSPDPLHVQRSGTETTMHVAASAISVYALPS